MNKTSSLQPLEPSWELLESLYGSWSAPGDSRGNRKAPKGVKGEGGQGVVDFFVFFTFQAISSSKNFFGKNYRRTLFECYVMATFSHFVATKMRPKLLSRHAAVSRIAT